MKKPIYIFILIATICCKSTKDDPIIAPPNSQLIMHLNTPFPYIEIRDESGKLLERIEIFEDENHIEISVGD